LHYLGIKVVNVITQILICTG